MPQETTKQTRHRDPHQLCFLGKGGKTRSVLKFRWGLNDPIIRWTRFEMGSGVGTVVGSVVGTVVKIVEAVGSVLNEITSFYPLTTVPTSHTLFTTVPTTDPTTVPTHDPI